MAAECRIWLPNSIKLILSTVSDCQYHLALINLRRLLRTSEALEERFKRDLSQII